MECYVCAETRKLLLITAASVLFLIILPLPYLIQVSVGVCIMLLLISMALPHLGEVSWHAKLLKR